MKAVRSSAESSASLNHRVDQIVHKIESGLELSRRGSGRIGDHLAAADVEEGLHRQVLASWLVSDAGRQGRIDDVHPVVHWGDHLLLDLRHTDIDLIGRSNSNSAASREQVIKDSSDGSDAFLEVISGICDAFASRLSRLWNSFRAGSREALVAAGEYFAMSGQESNEWASKAGTRRGRALRLPLSTEAESRLDKNVIGDRVDHRVLELEGSFFKIWDVWNTWEARNLALKTVGSLASDRLADLSTNALLIFGRGCFDGFNGSRSESSADGALSEGSVAIPGDVAQIGSRQNATILGVSFFD